MFLKDKDNYVQVLFKSGLPTCPLVAQMLYNILLYVSICVRYVTKIV